MPETSVIFRKMESEVFPPDSHNPLLPISFSLCTDRLADQLLITGDNGSNA